MTAGENEQDAQELAEYAGMNQVDPLLYLAREVIAARAELAKLRANPELIVVGRDGTPAMTVTSDSVMTLLEERGALQLHDAALRNTLVKRDRAIP